ncbi:hypothetical protein [Mariprofundus ferrooxydans]|nr:hypothetical protein [Mariprofundus ferrooxydans]
MKKKEQNNGLRMILFYLTCAVVVVIMLFGGLLFTKAHIVSGVTHNNQTELNEAINFHKLNNSVRGQMPGIMDTVKKDPNDIYSSSAIINSNHPNITVTPENVVELMIKTSIAKKDADGSVSFNDFDMSRESLSYSRLSLKFVSKTNKDDWFTTVIAKDGSVLVWKVNAVFLSPSLLDKLLQ